MEQTFWADKGTCEHFLTTVECGGYVEHNTDSISHLYHWDQMKYYVKALNRFMCPSLKDIRDHLSSLKAEIQFECIEGNGVCTLLVAQPL